MKAALSIVLAGFFFACLVAPLPLAGQACQGVAVPTGSRSVWLTSEDGTDKLAVERRYTGERLYGEASFGRRRSVGSSSIQFNNDGTTSIINWEFHSLIPVPWTGLD